MNNFFFRRNFQRKKENFRENGDFGDFPSEHIYTREQLSPLHSYVSVTIKHLLHNNEFQ